MLGQLHSTVSHPQLSVTGGYMADGSVSTEQDLQLPQSLPHDLGSSKSQGQATFKEWRNRHSLIKELQNQVITGTDIGRSRDL